VKKSRSFHGVLDIEILEEEVFDKCRGRPRVGRGDVGKGLPRAASPVPGFMAVN
jgi:hypothetical protein